MPFLKSNIPFIVHVSLQVNSSEGQLVVGFEDGVVRLLELYNPKSLRAVAGRSRTGDAELRLKQAFKPHNAPVTSIAYERNGTIMATGVRAVYCLDCGRTVVM